MRQYIKGGGGYDENADFSCKSNYADQLSLNIFFSRFARSPGLQISETHLTEKTIQQNITIHKCNNDIKNNSPDIFIYDVVYVNRL